MKPNSTQTLKMKGLIESKDKYISKRKSSFRNHPLYPSLISDDAPITSSGHSKSHKVGMPVSFRLNALATWLVTFLCLSLTFFYKWKFYLQNFTRTKKTSKAERSGERRKEETHYCFSRSSASEACLHTMSCHRGKCPPKTR